MAELFRTLGYMLIGILLVGEGQLAFAQQLLVLTANIARANAERLDAIDAFTNVEPEFATAVGATNPTRMFVLGNTNAISQTTFNQAPDPYGVVLVVSAYSATGDAHQAVIQSAAANRWANSFGFLVNGCCEGVQVGLHGHHRDQIPGQPGPLTSG